MVDIAALDPSVFDVGVKSKPAARATLVDGWNGAGCIAGVGSVLDVTAVNNPLLDALHVTDLDALALTAAVPRGAGRRTGTHCVERTIS